MIRAYLNLCFFCLKEQRKMQEDLFGYLAPLSMDQYKDFYKATGTY